MPTAPGHTPVRVTPVKTNVSADTFTEAVLADWSVTGETDDAPREAVGILFAHYMVETGGLNCYGNNIGNVKWTPADTAHDYHCLTGTWEGMSASDAEGLIQSGQAILDPNASHQKQVGEGRVSVVFQPPHPMTRFVEYDTLSDGMIDHLHMLRFKRYANAWPFIMAGDVLKFCLALKAKGYMTATAEAYANGMQPAYFHYFHSDCYDRALVKVHAENAAWVNPNSEEALGSGLVVRPPVDFPLMSYDIMDSIPPSSFTPGVNGNGGGSVA